VRCRFSFKPNPELPYLLRKYAHLCTTEAIAMLMGRLTKEPDWLTVYAGIPGPEAQRLRAPLQKQEKLGMLIFVRWCLVMVNFERDMYADPERDLNTLWWDYVERFQFLTRPANRQNPDWASKIHLGTSPVYYQNYLLGELIASQVLAALKAQGPKDRHPLVQNRAAGDFLRERVFRPGAKYSWNLLLEKATGEKLNPRHFVQQFVK
jgi:peptidyl-dipeptidase A